MTTSAARLLRGNEACVRAALLAGCRSFYGYPITPASDVLVAMNAPSLARFAAQVRPGGLVVVNASLMLRQDPLPQVEWLPVSAADEAERVGEPRAGSIVALAAAVARIGALPREALEGAVATGFPDPTKRERNLRALASGWEAGAIARRRSEVLATV